MRLFTVLLLIMGTPLLALADVAWQKFQVGSEGDKKTISLGCATVAIELQKTQASGFADDLLMTVKVAGEKLRQYYFTSAYGSGEVAIQGDILLLKYGVGRGTLVRVEHVKALRLGFYLQEVADVQSSYYILANPQAAKPDLFEYQLTIQKADGFTILSLRLPKPQKGLPTEKIVSWKNDA